MAVTALPSRSVSEISDVFKVKKSSTRMEFTQDVTSDVRELNVALLQAVESGKLKTVASLVHPKKESALCANANATNEVPIVAIPTRSIGRLVSGRLERSSHGGRARFGEDREVPLTIWSGS